MAVNAANFTATYQIKPSIFEIIAQQSLNDTLHPALEKLASLLSSNFPEKFSWISTYYDEIFVVLKGLLEYHYIERYNASFSENFYGLQRLTIITNGTLSKKQKQLSLLPLVVIPYIIRNIENRILVYRLERAEGALYNDFSGKFKKLLLHLHSISHVSWGLWTIINYIRYMSGRKESQTPLLSLLGLKLAYLENMENFDGFWTAFFRGQLSLSELSTGLIKNAVASTLEVAAFFMQFLQAWNSDKSNFKITSLPVPDPPQSDHKSATYRGKCPICLENWKIPTVLPVSGYVYCFACILNHLREERKCPVTQLPSKPMDLIRLYDS